MRLQKFIGEKKEQKEGRNYFVSTFQQKNIPDEIPEFKLAGMNIIDVLFKTNLAISRGDAKRLIRSGAIEINEERIGKVGDYYRTVDKNSIIKKGKRFFVKIV